MTTETREILRCAEVMRRAGFKSKATLYRWISNGLFCKPVKLGPRATGWYSDEVQDWINSRQRA